MEKKNFFSCKSSAIEKEVCRAHDMTFKFYGIGPRSKKLPIDSGPIYVSLGDLFKASNYQA